MSKQNQKNFDSRPAPSALSASSASSFEPLESRQYRSGTPDIGINVTEGSTRSVALALPVLKALHVTTIRMWCGVDSFNDRFLPAGLLRAIDYHKAGYDVTMTVANNDRAVPDPAEVKAWFKWVAGNDAVRGAVDRWEIGNEVDSDNYFKGTLGQYVTSFLKPASDALHAAGEKVVSAGVSWNPQDVQTLVNDGMLDMVDYVGFHPYARGVASQERSIKQLQAVVAGRKPLVATEWNVRGFENDKPAWARAVHDAVPQVQAGFDLSYYFTLFAIDSPAGPGGLMHRDGSLNLPFYRAFLSATQGLASGGTDSGNDTGDTGDTGGDDTPVLGSTPTPGNTNTNTGTNTNTNAGTNTNTNAGGNTAAGVETRIALYDATTERVISGYGDLKANQVIDLAKLPGRKLAIVVVPTKSAHSVKMTLNGKTVVQNTAPYTYFGDDGWGDLHAGNLAAGHYTLGVTPYTRGNAAGLAVGGRTVGLTFVDSKAKPAEPATPGTPAKPVTPTKPSTPSSPSSPASGPDADTTPEVTGLTLVDERTGRAVAGYEHLTSSTTIRLSSLPTAYLSLVADVDEDTRSVRLTTNKVWHADSTAPYAFHGDGFGAGARTHAGKYDFVALAYANAAADGTPGGHLKLSITFV